jgi:hypothetical protein
MQTNSTQSTQASRRRSPAYSVLIGVILLTIPCYLIGFAALFILQRTPVVNPSPTAAPSATVVQTMAPTATLGDLPTQFVPATAQPTVLQLTSTAPTSTPTFTFTPLGPTTTPTLIPTLFVATPTPTPSPSPAPTLDFTETPVPLPTPMP